MDHSNCHVWIILIRFKMRETLFEMHAPHWNEIYQYPFEVVPGAPRSAQIRLPTQQSPERIHDAPGARVTWKNLIRQSSGAPIRSKHETERVKEMTAYVGLKLGLRIELDGVKCLPPEVWEVTTSVTRMEWHQRFEKWLQVWLGWSDTRGLRSDYKCD